MKKHLEVDFKSEIFEGQSLGGISLESDISLIRNSSQFRYSFGYEIDQSVDRFLAVSLKFKSHFVTIKLNCEFSKIQSLTASKGYQGSWKGIFTPCNFRLSDLIKYDWTFEHMTEGLITSEKNKGIGFAIPDHMEDDYGVKSQVFEVSKILDFNDFEVEDIVVFPEFIGTRNNWDFYEAYIWDDNIRQRRKNDRIQQGFLL